MNCKIQKIKQNKKIVAIICIMLMVTSMLSISVFAYTDISTNGIDFTNQPLTMVEYSSSSNPYYFCSSSWGAYQRFYYYFTSESDFYTCFVKNQSGNYNYLVLSTTSGSGRYQFDSNSGSFTTTAHTGTDLYYTYPSSKNYVFESSWLQYSLIPSFNTETDAINAVKDWIENPPVTETTHSLSYDLAPGYVAFIDIHGLSNIQGSVSTSSGVALAPNEFIATNQLYGYTNTIPSSFNLPLNGSTSYSWNSNKVNVWGKSQHWSWLGTYSGGSNYLFISNPTYSNLFARQSNDTSMVLDNPSATNSYIHIYLSECYSIRIVSLNAQITYDPSQGLYGAIDNGNGDTIVDGTFDDSTGQWQYVNQTTGEAVGSELPVGGENDIQTPTSSDSIIGWLQTISNQISGFFNGAVGAISTLVSAGSSFFRVLTGLYSWLPVSVLSVLTSALVLIITIGFIKVFL